MSTGSKSLLTLLFLRVLNQYRRLIIQILKIHAAQAYLQGVNALRLTTIGLVVLGLCIGGFFTGFIMLHVALLVYVDWTAAQAALFLLVLGMLYIGIAVFVLCRALSSKRWVEMSRADEVLDKVAQSLHE